MFKVICSVCGVWFGKMEVGQVVCPWCGLGEKVLKLVESRECAINSGLRRKERLSDPFESLGKKLFES